MPSVPVPQIPAQAERPAAPLTATPTVLRQEVVQPRAAPAPLRTSLSARLEFADEPSRPSVDLTGGAISLGRDPGCTIVFETSAATVSRRHAEISCTSEGFVIADNNSFNGTLLNGQRLTEPAMLKNGDQIQIGRGGPIVVFISAPSASAGQASVASASSQEVREQDFSKTMVAKLDSVSTPSGTGTSAPQLLRTFRFSDKGSLTIGRDQLNDISLDGFQISNKHARLNMRGGEVVAEDLGSTNGTFVNGVRISKQSITPADKVQIGSFLIQYDGAGQIAVYDTRSKTRIDG